MMRAYKFSPALGVELRELVDSSFTLGLNFGFPSRCIRCQEYHVERATCEVPKTKYDMSKLLELSGLLFSRVANT